MGRFLQSAAVLAIACFFALMWGVYLRANLFAPASGLGAPAGYDSLLEPGQERRTMTWGIYLGELRVGSSTTDIRRESGDLTAIRTTTRFTDRVTRAVRLLAPVEGDLVVEFRADVSPLLGLRSFRLNVDALDILLQGIPQDDGLRLTGHAGDRAIRETLPFERRNVVSSTLTPVAAAEGLTEASLGQSWEVTMVVPLTSQVRTVQVTPVERRTLVVSTEPDAEPEPVFKLQFRMGADSWVAWVRADGDPLVQTLPPPLPVVLRREDLNTDALGQLPIGAATAQDQE